MKTVADILLCFLTTTDIMGGLVAMPYFAAESILRAMNLGNPCSIFLTRTLIGMFFMDITIITSILVVLDRYFAIFYPYSYNTRKNHTGFATFLVISLWCVCAIICLLSIITSRYILAIAFIASADICFVFLSIWVHSKIFLKARRTQQEIANISNRFERSNSKIDSWHRIKGTRITALIFCGIFLCYAPQIITGSLMEYSNNSRFSKIAFYWTTALMLLNSIVNPLVYIWQVKWFRNALRRITSDRAVCD